MRTLQTMFGTGSLLALVFAGVAQAQTTDKPNLTKQPTLYVVGYPSGYRMAVGVSAGH